MRVCENLYNLMKEHNEWGYDNEKYWNRKLVEIEQNGDYTSYTMYVSFDKYGREIFRARDDGEEDDDFPELVGEDLLRNMTKQSAKKAGFTLDSTVTSIISPNEKGSLSVGFTILKKNIK